MSAFANATQNDLITNKPASEVINDKVLATDVLIIGAGLAGLSTALALPKSLTVTILSKAELQACSSHYAQGGIAASLDKNDSVKAHVADTLVAGAGLCAADNTTSILSAGQQAVQWLCEQGVPFTQIPKTDATLLSKTIGTAKFALTTDDLHLTKEGGHGCRRVAHADDTTGRYVMEALTSKAQAASHITILPFHEAVKLITAENNRGNNRCQGAVVFDHHSQRQLTIYSKAVVMASGGLGQLFQRASAPNVCVGDGVMMAWQAGCRLANLEFIQFHPTGLALGDSSFLISEALRGEGGRLYCPLTGKRFMLAIDERAELAPRDIVARAIAEQIGQNGLGYVHLDVSHLPSDFIIEHFPQIYQTVLALGIDMTTSPIPVAPTAHYSCGGIVTDANGLSDVLGLYAAGEVAYTGLHGANRLASNSLLECIVVGRNIAAHLPNYLNRYLDSRLDGYLVTADWLKPKLSDTQTIPLPNTILASLNTNKDDKGFDLEIDNTDMTDISDIAASLKSLMTQNMGIVRHADSLKQALLTLQHWQRIVNTAIANLSCAPLIADNKPSAINANILRYLQLKRQLQLATLITYSALSRHESRGGHYRQDYPAMTDMALVSIIEPTSDKQIHHNKLDKDLNYVDAIEIADTNSESFQTLATI